MTRYSQNDEQDVILRYFGKRKGRFLDIGAYDGVTFSNTRALLELGWTGTLVEPDPLNLAKLITNTRQFAEQVEIVCGAVHPDLSLEGVYLRMDETPDRGWASTIVEANPGVLRPMPLKVRVAAIAPMDLDVGLFLSLDAEHMDFEILMAMEEDLHGCEMICIEPSGWDERSEMKKYLRDIYFSVLHETPENIIAIRNP